MLRLIPTLLLILILTACADKSHDVNLQEKLKKDTTSKSQQIIFGQPEIIDSSHIVIYPLILQKESYGSSYGSSSGGQKTAYWNLLFYNTETQKQNLLTTNKKLLIYSINLNSSSSSSLSDEGGTSGIDIYKYNIIYSAVAKDYDANNKLDEDDPVYLFASNRDGTNFRQISPDNYNINSWEVIKGTTKIIMQGQKDDNADKLFNESDANIPLIVDTKSGNLAVESFRRDFIDSLKQRLITIWKP